MGLPEAARRNLQSQSFEKARLAARAAESEELEREASLHIASSNRELESEVDILTFQVRDAELAGNLSAQADSLFNLGHALLRSLRLDEALSAFTGVVDLVGRSGVLAADAHSCVGFVRLMRGDDAQAVVALEAAAAGHQAEDSLAIGDGERIALLGRREWTDKLLQRALLRLGRPEEALLACERGRAAALLHHLARARNPVDSGKFAAAGGVSFEDVESLREHARADGAWILCYSLVPAVGPDGQGSDTLVAWVLTPAGALAGWRELDLRAGLAALFGGAADLSGLADLQRLLHAAFGVKGRDAQFNKAANAAAAAAAAVETGERRDDGGAADAERAG